MTKKKHRALEALRRLGAEPPPPDPNYRCQHKGSFYVYGQRCDKPPVRLRECWWDNQKRWYCVEHDPARIYHEQRNRKKREEEKRQRWKAMERDRKPS